METKEFTLNDKQYLAIKYSSKKYGIVSKVDNKPVPNMKEIAREYLKKFGIDVSTDANVMNTYSSIKLVMEHC